MLGSDGAGVEQGVGTETKLAAQILLKGYDTQTLLCSTKFILRNVKNKLSIPNDVTLVRTYLQNCEICP